MRTLAFLALSAIGFTASAAPTARPPVRAICEGRSVPFALPDASTLEDITDAHLDALLAQSWDAYCAGVATLSAASYERRACACRDRLAF